MRRQNGQAFAGTVLGSNMSRRSFVIAMGALATGALAGCGSDSDSGGDGGQKGPDTSSSNSKQETKQAEPAKERDKNTVAVTIDGAQMATDYDGKPCVVVNFTFTNVSNEDPQSFVSSTYVEVYQNGVQCDTAVTDSADGSSTMTNVQAGSSVAVQEAFTVQDTSEIDVQVFAVETMLDDKPIAEQKIALA